MAAPVVISPGVVAAAKRKAAANRALAIQSLLGPPAVTFPTSAYGPASIGASAAALASSVGYTAGVEGLLGTLTLNPYTAIPAAALLILELAGLLPSFAGRPKLLDTAQAAQRLLNSPFQALQDLGKFLYIRVKNGVPLSTGDPKLQGQIRRGIQGTVRTILAQYPLAGTADSIDALVNQALTSENGVNATNQLNALLTRSAMLANKPAGLMAAQPAAPAPPSPPSQPRNPAVPRYQPGGSTEIAPAGQPIVIPPSTPSGLRTLITTAAQTLASNEYVELGACIGLILAEQPAVALKCLEGLLARVVTQGAKDIIASFRQYLQNQFGTRPSPAPTSTGRYVTQPAGQPAPLLSSKPCVSCMSPKQRAQYEQEQRDLRTEIQTETEQATQQSLDNIQSQLDDLKQLETQPAGQRNIPQELEQKRALARQLQQIEQGGQPGGGQPAEPLSGPDPEELRAVCEAQCAPRAGQPDYEACVDACWGRQGSPLPGQSAPALQPPSAPGVQFCLACKSEEDAILFLNGEQAACSVMPGTTKPLAGVPA